MAVSDPDPDKAAVPASTPAPDKDPDPDRAAVPGWVTTVTSLSRTAEPNWPVALPQVGACALDVQFARYTSPLVLVSCW